jgi:hypothetical protein
VVEIGDTVELSGLRQQLTTRDDRQLRVGESTQGNLVWLSYRVAEGISGLWHHPMQGAERAGMWGFVSGMGKGVVGAFAAPIGGAMEIISRSSFRMLEPEIEVAAEFEDSQAEATNSVDATSLLVSPTMSNQRLAYSPWLRGPGEEMFLSCYGSVLTQLWLKDHSRFGRILICSCVSEWWLSSSNDPESQTQCNTIGSVVLALCSRALALVHVSRGEVLWTISCQRGLELLRLRGPGSVLQIRLGEQKLAQMTIGECDRLIRLYNSCVLGNL